MFYVGSNGITLGIDILLIAVIMAILGVLWTDFDMVCFIVSVGLFLVVLEKKLIWIYVTCWLVTGVFAFVD